MLDSYSPWQWNVDQLSNGHYTIQNYGHNCYANCQTGDWEGIKGYVISGDREEQWIIEEEGGYFTYVSNHSLIGILNLTVMSGGGFSIHSSKPHNLFWELQDDQADTCVRQLWRIFHKN